MHRITRQPPEPGGVWLTQGPGRGGGGGAGGGGDSRAALTQGGQDPLLLPALEAPAERLGRVGGGGSQGARKADVTNFSSALAGLRQLGTSQSGRTGWGARPLGGRGWGQWKFWGSRVGWVCLPGVPTLSLNHLNLPPIPHASQPQPKILATEEIIGRLVPANKGCKRYGCPRGI